MKPKESLCIAWQYLTVVFILILLPVTTAVNATTENPPTAFSDTATIMQHAAFKNALQAYKRNQFKKAEQIFQKLLHKYPRNSIILNNLAVVIAQQGQHDRAARLFKEMIAADEVLYTGYRNLSSIYAYQATKAYRQALSLTVNSPKPLHLIFIGHVDKASPSPPVAQQILADKNINNPLVQDPEAPLADAETDVVNEIKASVKRWARAWSDQNINNYLESYRERYAPPGKTHREWKILRIRRLRTPREIQVTVSNMRVRQDTPDKATVTFRQNYRSNLLTSTVTKRLQMSRFNDKWKITHEMVLH